MYKTVRKGENSLQYTIVPQTEEMLCNSDGVVGKGRDYSSDMYLGRLERVEKRSRWPCFFACFVALAIVFGSILTADFYMQKYITSQSISQEGVNAIVSTIDATATNDSAKSRKKELRIPEAPVAKIAGLDISPANFTPRFEDPERLLEAYNKYQLKHLWNISSEPAATDDIDEIFLPTSADSPQDESDGLDMQVWNMSQIRELWNIYGKPIVRDQEQLKIPKVPFSSLSSKNKSSATDAIIHPTVTIEPTTTPKTVASTNGPTKSVELASITPKPKTEKDVLISTKHNTVHPRPVPAAKIDNKIESTNPNYPLGKDLKAFRDSILDSDYEEFANWATMSPMHKMSPKEVRAKMREYYEQKQVGLMRKEEMPGIWPFGSSTTLFQWPDYSFPDTMMMPLLVGTGSMLTITLIMAAIVARRRRAILAKIQMNVEAQTDDDTTLLTVEKA